MPPSPLQAVTAAAKVALFHWPESCKFHVIGVGFEGEHTNNVRRLIRVHRGPIAHIRSSREVRSYIPHCDLICESEHAEPHDRTYGVEDNNQTSQLIIVSNNTTHYDWHDCIKVGWCRKQD